MSVSRRLARNLLSASWLWLGMTSLAWSQGGSPAEGAAISARLLKLGDSSGTPQIDLALTTGDTLLYSARYAHGKGVTTLDDAGAEVKRFHAASISKLLTATVIMQLRDEGRLSTTDPVSKYVPEFGGSPIRIEHLLTHTSGLRDSERAKGRTTRDQVDLYIKHLARQRPARAPGTEWNYADAGFNLLGAVIEKVAGRDFATVMRERVLEPVGMTVSDFDLDPIPPSSRIPSFAKRGKPLAHPWDIAFRPSSGLQTSVRDLAAFARAILNVASSGQGSAILRPGTLAEMTTVRTATRWAGIAQGYGWQLEQTTTGPVWRHAGGESGFESLLALYPDEGFALALMGNQDDWPRFQLAGEIAALRRSTR